MRGRIPPINLSRISGLIKLVLDIRSPKGEVVSKKLHYECAVFVGFFSQGVQLSNCFLKSLSNMKTNSVKQILESVRMCSCCSTQNSRSQALMERGRDRISENMESCKANMDKPGLLIDKLKCNYPGRKIQFRVKVNSISKSSSLVHNQLTKFYNSEKKKKKQCIGCR